MSAALPEALRGHLDLGETPDKVAKALNESTKEGKAEFLDRLLMEALLIDALAPANVEAVAKRQGARRVVMPMLKLLSAAALLMVAVGLLWFWQARLAVWWGYAEPELVMGSSGEEKPVVETPKRAESINVGAGGARLTMGGYCDLSLKPGAQLILRGSARKEAVELVEGCVVSQVKPQRGEFTLHTPLGWIKVKGTEFVTIVEYAPSRESAGLSPTVTVTVTMGAVEYRLGDRTGTLQTGESRIFTGGKGPVKVTEVAQQVVPPPQAPPVPQAGATLDDQAESLYIQARRAERNRNVEEANKLYTELITKFPKQFRAGCALVNMGLNLMNLQRYDEAAEAFRRAVRDYPEVRYRNGKLAAPFAAYFIASCLYQKGDMDEAMEAFDEALKKYPDATTESGKLLSDLFLDMTQAGGGRLPEAKGGPPDEARTLYFEGVNRRSKRDLEGATRIYKEVVANYVKSNWAGCALADTGEILMSQQKYDEAMEAFRRALREYPESRYGNDKPVASVAAYEIVYCLSMKGELEEAKKAYEEAVKKYPNATTPNGRFLKDIFAPPADEGEVLYRRAESLRSKKPEESLKIHQDLLAKYPKHRLAGAALTNSGRILYRFGRFDEAVAAMKRVLAEYPDSRFWSGGVCAMTAAYELGYWYYEKKDMQNAKKAFDFAVARYPDGAYYSKQYAGIIKEVNEAVGKPREDTKPVGEPKAP